jgi:Icc-related predicted phosphoesterase
VQFGALGDIHGDFDAVRRIQRRHPEIGVWLCVGDVADGEGRYESFPVPVHFIKGNNDGFDAIAKGTLPEHVHFLVNGVPHDIGGLRVAGLGGTFAPTWYDTAPDALPHPQKGTARATEQADKRRHFVRSDVDACSALRDIDVFLTHEAARPYIVGGGAGRRGIDAGKTPVNEVLKAMQPRLHLFGHHHRFTEQERQGVPSLGLDLASRSYLLVDSESMAWSLRTEPGSAD